MDLGLKDRVAFVAGSSRGTAKAIAAAFLAEGCRTVVTGRTAETLRSTAAGLEQQFTPDHVMAVVGDLTDLTVIRKMLAQVRERWGGVDFGSLMECLRRVRYAGDFVLETPRGPLGHEVQSALQNREFLIQHLAPAFIAAKNTKGAPQ